MNDVADYLTNDPNPNPQPPADRYAYSLDQEIYRGQFPSRDAAIQDAMAEHDSPGELWTGRCVDVDWTAVAEGSDAELMIENMIERLEEQIGEAADNFQPSQREATELQSRINGVVRVWIEQVKPAVYRVADVQLHEIDWRKHAGKVT